MVLMGLLTGCTATPIVDQVVVPPLPPPKTLGSLWQEENGRAYLYEDLRAMRVGDILTVQIVETNSGSKSADTSAGRESTIDNSITGAFGLDPTGVLLKKLAVDASAQNEFEGSGETTREDSLTGTISAMVTEVLPNGDLRIKGRREVTVNNEKQVMTLTGVVRRLDVDTRNTVLSTAIADARIEYYGMGVVTDVQHPGWVVRILNWVNPF